MRLGNGGSHRLQCTTPQIREGRLDARRLSIYPAIAAPGGRQRRDRPRGRATGRHYLTVSGGTGDYDVTLEVYRPAPESPRGTQTIFLDFDGARVNTGIFGGPGVRTVTVPAFLGRWGIPPSRGTH